jgi:hypothetical protein
MRNIKLYENFINEKKPKGAPDWHDSDAPDAEGRFRDLSPKKLAAWLIKTRNKDVKKISGSLTQQVVFNRKSDPEYADKMERTRKEVYKQLGREDLLDNMEESVELNEKMKILMRSILLKMIPSAFGASSPVAMRKELESAVAAAITPILLKYDYVVESLDEAVSVETFRYESSHNKKPKGTGLWAFSYNKSGDDTFFVPNTMSYVDAKKWAQEQAKKDGKSTVYVMESNDHSIVEEEGRDTLAELNEMTLGQLERIEDYAEMIAERMEAGQELESWMFSQITVALENLNSVHDAMDGGDGVEEGMGSRINKYSPNSYAERVASGSMSFEDAMEESGLPFVLLMKLVKKIDKTFKVTFESKHVKGMDQYITEKAKGNRGPLDNPDIEVALKKKAEESGIDIALLRIVMRRGMDAWNSGHRPGMGQEQWGYARVNSFIDKEKGTWGGADKDVAAEVK